MSNTILNIETATKNCSVSISRNGKLIALCEEYDENHGHSYKLHTFVKWALEGANIKINEIDAVCIASGPGSYTGLRIGAAAAKGICYSLDIPLLSVYSLDGMAFANKSEEITFLIPMIDARRMEVYTAIYSNGAKMKTAVEAKVIDENSYEDLKEKKVSFFGDGALKCVDLLSNKNWTFKDFNPSAKYMVELSNEKFNSKEFEDLESFNPTYLKEFRTSLPKKKIY